MTEPRTTTDQLDALAADLTDAQKLQLLAAWFDMWDRPETDRQAILDDRRNPGRNDVQRDLLRIAATLEAAVRELDALRKAAREYRAAEWAMRIAHDETGDTCESMDVHNALVETWRAADAALCELLGIPSPFKRRSLDVRIAAAVTFNVEDGDYGLFIEECRAYLARLSEQPPYDKADHAAREDAG